MGWLVPGGGGQPRVGGWGLWLLSFPKPPGNQGPSIIQHQAAGNGGVGGGKGRKGRQGEAGQGPWCQRHKAKVGGYRWAEPQVSGRQQGSVSLPRSWLKWVPRPRGDPAESGLQQGPHSSCFHRDPPLKTQRPRSQPLTQHSQGWPVPHSPPSPCPVQVAQPQTSPSLSRDPSPAPAARRLLL